MTGQSLKPAVLSTVPSQWHPPPPSELGSSPVQKETASLTCQELHQQTCPETQLS